MFAACRTYSLSGKGASCLHVRFPDACMVHLVCMHVTNGMDEMHGIPRSWFRHFVKTNELGCLLSGPQKAIKGLSSIQFVGLTRFRLIMRKIRPI